MGSGLVFASKTQSRLVHKPVKGLTRITYFLTMTSSHSWRDGITNAQKMGKLDGMHESLWFSTFHQPLLHGSGLWTLVFSSRGSVGHLSCWTGVIFFSSTAKTNKLNGSNATTSTKLYFILKLQTFTMICYGSACYIEQEFTSVSDYSNHGNDGDHDTVHSQEEA